MRPIAPGPIGRMYLSVHPKAGGTRLVLSKSPSVGADAWLSVRGQIQAGEETLIDIAPAPAVSQRGHAVLGANGTVTILFTASFAAKPVVLLQREGAVGAVIEPVITGFTRASNASNASYTGFTVSASRVGLLAGLLSIVSGTQLAGTVFHWSATAAS